MSGAHQIESARNRNRGNAASRMATSRWPLTGLGPPSGQALPRLTGRIFTDFLVQTSQQASLFLNNLLELNPLLDPIFLISVLLAQYFGSNLPYFNPLAPIFFIQSSRSNLLDIILKTQTSGSSLSDIILLIQSFVFNLLHLMFLIQSFVFNLLHLMFLIQYSVSNLLDLMFLIRSCRKVQPKQ